MQSCSISGISWERVNLTLTAVLAESEEPPEDVQFKIVDGRRRLPVRTTPCGDGRYRLDLNVTTFSGRRHVPNGTWRIVPFLDGRAGPAAGYDLDDVGRLDQDSRTFLYNRNQAAYIVAFGIAEDDDHPDLLMRTYQMGRKAKPSPKAAKPRLTARVRQRVLTQPRRRKLATWAYELSRMVKPSNGATRILFASEMRTSMEGNLARVHERMVQRGLTSRYRFRYSFRVPRIANKLSTLRTIYLLATSDVVLIDDYFNLLEKLPLSPKTKIIQLWHAGSGFKSVGYSRFGRYGSPRLESAHRKYTYAITGSTHLVPVYAEAFGMEESAVIPTGLPRVDTFLDADRTRRTLTEFYAKFPHLQGKRIILFAPTFRGRGIHDAYYDYSRIDFARLYEACGTNSVVLFRMHHFVRGSVPIPPEYSDRLIDAATFPDTNDLLHASSVLVTDYSSIIYEFSLLNKPMLFYAYDKKVYSATRGFHRDYDLTAPGKVCESFDDLVKALQTEDYDTWKIEQFRRENFDRIDTGSADRVIDWLILGDPPTPVAAQPEAQHEPAIDTELHENAALSDELGAVSQ